MQLKLGYNCSTLKQILVSALRSTTKW